MRGTSLLSLWNFLHVGFKGFKNLSDVSGVRMEAYCSKGIDSLGLTKIYEFGA